MQACIYFLSIVIARMRTYYIRFFFCFIGKFVASIPALKHSLEDLGTKETSNVPKTKRTNK